MAPQKQPKIHVLGDFNYSKIDWETRLNKESGANLNDTDGNMFVDMSNKFGLEQLVNFPTRNLNTLDLILSSTPNNYLDIFSLDKFSDHDVIAAALSLKTCFKQNNTKFSNIIRQTLNR